MSDEAKLEAQTDPREALAKWANSSDEWVRFVVRSVLATGRRLDVEILDQAYALFRQEKSFEERTLPKEPPLETSATSNEKEDPLVITRLSEVHGVNAIVPGSVIEPHEGLTILYGENGTGKTGYARIFKMLAASRTADEILGNVDEESVEPISAKVDFRVGDEAGQFDWQGESGKAPFTRMSIFDSRAVNIHVDDDIEYVYTPAVLSIFEHVIAGLQDVQSRITAKVRELRGGTHSPLLGRFPRSSTVYPFIETLGASSDLEMLKQRASTDPEVEVKIEKLRGTIAALQANTLGLQISSRESAERALGEAVATCTLWAAFDSAERTRLIAKKAELSDDYSKFRTELFASADLPADPEDTWESFVRAGADYQDHLDGLGLHDDSRCLYCRQGLADDASSLLAKYSQYIEDKISADLSAATKALGAIEAPLLSADTSAIDRLLTELSTLDDVPSYVADLKAVATNWEATLAALATGAPVSEEIQDAERLQRLTAARSGVREELTSLRAQAENREETLEKRQTELIELTAAAELTKSWSAIDSRVQDAKQADRLSTFSSAIPTLSRAVTALSKDASNQLINNSFEELFHEECRSLRAKELKLQFVGREGKAQRRKIISGKHKPSKVFSEGEQKVLAIADFLAEARLAGIGAPVIFDDPVSSLDYRRIDEVAERVAKLSDEVQVLVFTHDILFTTKLLSLFEKSKRCTYLQISDDESGKGKVTPASGPRWDSLAKLKGRINKEIQSAEAEVGEARDAHVRVAYSWIRSWCEVFIEQEVLQGVTQRLQPNVAMGALTRIKTDALSDCFAQVTRVFDDACRYIEGHSQPLATLAVAATLEGVKADWETLKTCKQNHDNL